MEIKATVQLTKKQLFEFLIRHSYFTFSGMIGLILSIMALGGFFLMLGVEGASGTYLGALLVTGLLFTVVQPIMILQNAKKQSKVYEKYALNYTITAEGIHVTQDDAEGQNGWGEVIKIVSTKRLIIMYTSKVHAYVIPRDAIGENIEDLRTIIRENCNARYIKL